MVHPSVPSILLTPICPHSLNFRCAALAASQLRRLAAAAPACPACIPASFVLAHLPFLPPSLTAPSFTIVLLYPVCSPVILPDYVELELRIAPDARCPAVVCFDGRDSRELLQVGRPAGCWQGGRAAGLELGFASHGFRAGRRLRGSWTLSKPAGGHRQRLRPLSLEASLPAAQQGDSIKVRMSPNPVPTINNADQARRGSCQLESFQGGLSHVQPVPGPALDRPHWAANRGLVCP